MTLSRPGYLRLILFLLIAITLSNVFRFDLLAIHQSLKNFPTWFYILTGALLEGSGVFLGALIARHLLRKERRLRITFFGTSLYRSLIMCAIPMILLLCIGVRNDFGINAHVYGLMAGLGSILYCIFEEYGWRGYLQEEFSTISPSKRYVLIGLIWYVWHLSFLTVASWSENLLFLAMLILGSWGIGQVVESTRSIAASACFHLAIQLMMFNSFIKDGLDGTQKLVILVVCVVAWIGILRRWKSMA